MEANYFTSFICTRCNTEIEASSDLIGQETECPACGAKIVIPDSPTMSDGISRHGADESQSDSVHDAMKSRTIRIDLGDF